MLLRSIRSQLLGLVVATVVPFTALIGIGLWSQWQNDQAAAIQRAMNDARLVAAQVDDYIGNLDNLLTGLSRGGFAESCRHRRQRRAASSGSRPNCRPTSATSWCSRSMGRTSGHRPMPDDSMPATVALLHPQLLAGQRLVDRRCRARASGRLMGRLGRTPDRWTSQAKCGPSWWSAPSSSIFRTPSG